MPAARSSFWIHSPRVLFDKHRMLELWPLKTMTSDEKLNAITRLIVVLSLAGWACTQSATIILVGAACIACIAVSRRPPKVTAELFRNHPQQQQQQPRRSRKSAAATLDAALLTECLEGSKKNPFSNVLLTQIGDAPDRKAAPPAFNAEVGEDITRNVKRAVQMLNPGIAGASKQLYGDAMQEMELEQSNRQFYSTANSRVSNDQGAFASFLYGSMPSSKESDPAAAMARVQNTVRHTLY